MPKLTSKRDSRNVTGLDAAPQITGTASGPDGDILRTASEPDIGHDTQGFGTQLDSWISLTTTTRVWSSAAAFMIAPDPREGKCSFELDRDLPLPCASVRLFLRSPRPPAAAAYGPRSTVHGADRSSDTSTTPPSAPAAT